MSLSALGIGRQNTLGLSCHLWANFLVCPRIYATLFTYLLAIRTIASIFCPKTATISRGEDEKNSYCRRGGGQKINIPKKTWFVADAEFRNDPKDPKRAFVITKVTVSTAVYVQLQLMWYVCLFPWFLRFFFAILCQFSYIIISYISLFKKKLLKITFNSVFFFKGTQVNSLVFKIWN